MPRYVWNMFTTKKDNIEKFDWSEENTLVATTNTLPYTFVKDPDMESVENLYILCANSREGEYQEVRADAYYKVTEPSETTYETYPYVKITGTEEHADTYIWILSAMIEEPTPEDNITDGSKKLTVISKQWGSYLDEVYVKGDKSLGITTSGSRTYYPDNNFKDIGEPPIGNPDEILWFEYVGEDNPDPTIKYDKDSISNNGSFVIAEIVPSDSTVYDLNPSYKWQYTTNNGDSWSTYAENVIVTKYPFDVPGNTTGFSVRIIMDDGFGYKIEYIQGEMLTVTVKHPPTDPKITAPDTITENKTYVISWSPSTDEDDDFITYELDEKTDSSNWINVYTGDSTQYQTMKQRDISTIQYRVRAKDETDLYSSYSYSSIISITVNHPPLISGENKNLGFITEFNESYIITDTDSDTLSAIEYLDDKPTKTIDSVTPGQTYQIQITGGEWDKLSDITHIVKVVATDVNGASSQRSWVFRKNSGSSEDVDQEFYRLYQKQKDGSYKLFRFENVTENVYHHDFHLDSVLDQSLPEVRPTNDLPEDISEGKIIIGNDKVWVGGANGTVIELTKQKGGHVAQSTPPADTSLLWVDTSDPASPLLRFYNGSKWDYIKSVYSGGTKG